MLPCTVDFLETTVRGGNFNYLLMAAVRSGDLGWRVILLQQASVVGCLNNQLMLVLDAMEDHQKQK